MPIAIVTFFTSELGSGSVITLSIVLLSVTKNNVANNVTTMYIIMLGTNIIKFTIAFANKIKTDDEIEYPDSKIVIG